MTYLEKTLLNNPTLSASQIIAEMCPSDIGLEETSFCQALEEGFSMSFEICGNCWRREMPDE